MNYLGPSAFVLREHAVVAKQKLVTQDLESPLFDAYKNGQEIESVAHEFSHAVTLGMNVDSGDLATRITDRLREMKGEARDANELDTLAVEIHVLEAMGMLPNRREFALIARDSLIADTIPFHVRVPRVLKRALSREIKLKARAVVWMIHSIAMTDKPWPLPDLDQFKEAL
jgi:hypothetical protein